MTGLRAGRISGSPPLSARILGQLSLMQSVVISLPDENAIFSFACRGLQEMPGVTSVQYLATPLHPAEASTMSFSLRSSERTWGSLIFRLSDPEAFAPYQDYLRNFCFMLAVILEERFQRRLNESNRTELEERIQERTRQLNARIAEQKIVEESLRDSERRFQLATASARIGVWDWDIEAETLKWDSQMLEHYGIPRESFFGRFEDWENRVHPEDRAATQEAVSKALAGERPYDTEFRVLHPDGTSRILKANGIILRAPDGRPVRMIGVNRDITQERRVRDELIAAKEAAEKLSRLKSRFMDIAAHELRTPVTALSSLLQLLQKQQEKGVPIASSSLQRLRRQTDRLTRLVTDLLEISRLERGLLRLHLEFADLGTLISECIAEFADRAPERTIRFAKPEARCEARMDPVRIHQVLANLLDNALKYTPEASPIEVTLESLPERLRVSVQDRGPGVPQELQEVLFKPFSRGSSDEHERSAGLGLGLYICHEILALHGGSIGLDSRPGAGSRFYFELPNLKPPYGAPEPAARASSEETG